MIEHSTTDSNILIYSFDPTDPQKHKASIAIMAAMMAAHAVLPMQCLVEFYSVTTRKKYLTPERAAHQRTFEGMTVINPFNLSPAELDQLLT